MVHRFGAEDGKPLLAIHGVIGHGRRYRALAEEGVPERRWLAVDLRGHGSSDWTPPWNTEQHLADLLETLDAEDISSCDVVGHSFGGHLAIHMAAAAPERVERLVLLDPSSARDPEEMLQAAEETRRDEGWSSEAEARAARAAGWPPPALPYVAEDLDVILERGDDGGYRMRYCRSAVVAAWGEMARPAAALAGWGGAALLVAAMHDSTVSAELLAALRQDLGDRLEERLVDGGHVVYWDAFDDVVAALRAFLLPPSAVRR